MSDSTLYDDDILLWSEQQASAIRRLARGRDVPNELDLENVAEEIESVGRSELAAVESYIRLIFVHFIKLVAEVNSHSAGHWRGEISAFQFQMKRRYAPSMRQRIDFDDIWRSAREQLLLAYDGEQHQCVVDLSSRSPFELDELLAERIDVVRLAERLRHPNS
jgi:hypothetical protein